MLFDDVLKALQGTGIPFAENGWKNAGALESDFGVITLDNSPGALWADGHMRTQILEGTVDMFTRDNGRRQMRIIQDVMNRIEGLSWRLSVILYEEDTGPTHYEWIIQLTENE